MKFSYSKLSTFTTCPQRYKFKYVDNIPDFSTTEMALGSNLHETIHKILKDQPVDAIDNEFIISRAKDVVDVVKKKYTIVGSEVYFNLPIEEHEFEGFIDLISKDASGNIYVLDFKLGSGSLLQTALYAWMLEKAKGKQVQFVGLLKVSLNGDEVVTENIKPFTDEYRSQVERFITTTIEQIQKEEFQPKAGEHCSKCSYVEMCPLRSFILEKHLDFLTIEQKLDLLQYIDAFKDGLQKQLKDVLQTVERVESDTAIAYLEESAYKRLAVKKLPDEVYTTLFDTYGFEAFEPRKELVEKHFPNFFKSVSQKRLKITAKEG